jgi:RNA polymerase sigma factor (TIGR02999 family)
MASEEDITKLLEQWQDGGDQAEAKLIERVYLELKRISKSVLGRRRQTIQTTELVNEAWIGLSKGKDIHWRDRAHFFGLAAKIMRQILIDRIRHNTALKRGGGFRDLPFELIAEPAAESKAPDMLLLDEALNVLEQVHPDQCRLVELRYFVGLTNDEAAEILQTPPRTLKRQWQKTRQWLHRFMTGRTKLGL